MFRNTVPPRAHPRPIETTTLPEGRTRRVYWNTVPTNQGIPVPGPPTGTLYKYTLLQHCSTHSRRAVQINIVGNPWELAHAHHLSRSESYLRVNYAVINPPGNNLISETTPEALSEAIINTLSEILLVDW